MLIEKINSPDFNPESDWIVQHTNNYEAFKYPEGLSPDKHQQIIEFMQTIPIAQDDYIIHEWRFTHDHMRNLLGNFLEHLENTPSQNPEKNGQNF